jgi:endonuclease/exonuclease/phosphatase family metal-dependent hydrolase
MLIIGPRKIVKYVVVGVTTLLALLYLMGIAAGSINTIHFPASGLLTLLFPYIATLLFLLAIFWFISKPLIGFIVSGVLLIGSKNLLQIIALNALNDFNNAKSKNDIRIITWNIRGFNGMFNNKVFRKSVRTEIAEAISKLDADIVCLQEFNSSNYKEADNLSLLTAKFPYYYFPGDYFRKKGEYKTGCVIFSKWPIINKAQVTYPIAESLLYADVVIAKDTIRVFTTHLQSFKFNKKDYAVLDEIAETQQPTKEGVIALTKKVIKGFEQRGKQVAVIKAALQQSRYANIICGDFNDVPASYTYKQIKGNMQDAFIAKSFGVGKTFTSLAPTLRIDYLFADKSFVIKQVDLVDLNLSDHLMLVSDVALQ